MKIQPFADARLYVDNGCGSATNGDPGVQVPTIAYRPGEQITVDWTLTIPHPADNLDSGIRVAVHYGAGDSFDSNILTGGVVGSGQPGTVSAGLQTITVALPTGKTCDYCTLQWVWSANQDGGSYIGCTDIAITASGALPNYATLPPQTGNVLPGVLASPSGPGSILVAAPPPPPPCLPALPCLAAPLVSNSQQRSPAPDTMEIFFALVAVAAAGGSYYHKKKKGFYPWQKPGDAKQPTMTRPPPPPGATEPPPPPPPAAQVAALPSDWTPQLDPATQKTYYYNTKTGATQWVPPNTESV